MLIKLSRQLHDLEFCDAHLLKNFLDAVHLNHVGTVVLLAQQTESVLDIDLLELGIALQTEDFEEFVEVQAATLLFKHLLELADLFLVGLEANHAEDALQCVKVNALLTLPLVRSCLKHKNLLEVPPVHVTYA